MVTSGMALVVLSLEWVLKRMNAVLMALIDGVITWLPAESKRGA